MTQPIATSKKGPQEVYRKHELCENSKYVRVLDILPVSSPINEEPIKSVFRVINLEKDSNFAALSYVWGDYAPVQPHTVFCDNICFNVTTNCFSALSHLRKSLGGFTIWVDSLCINQNDDAEKSQQISIMGDIYTNAKPVYVWLGEATESTNRAMTYLSNAGLHRYFRMLPNGTKESRPYAAAWALYASWLSPTKHPFPYVASFSDPWKESGHWTRSKPWIRRERYAQWSDLRHLLGREWIRRAWTYQEILLASRPVLVCGNAHLSWADLEWSLLFLCNIQHNSLRGIVAPWASLAFDRERLNSFPRPDSDKEELTLREYESFVRLTLKLRHLFHWAIAAFLLVIGATLIISAFILLKCKDVKRVTKIALVSFGAVTAMVGGRHIFSTCIWDRFDPSNITTSATDDLMSGIYRRQATDPRDMAYGLWAVLKRRGAAVPPPSYTRDISWIYKVFTAHLAQMTNSMDFLYLAAAQRQTGAPSWVPDWSANRRNEWRSDHGAAGTDKQGLSLESSEEVARRCSVESAGIPFSFDKSLNILTVLAHDLGSISGRVFFHRTSEVFVEFERSLHIDNLQTMLSYAEWTLDHGFSICHTLFESGIYINPFARELGSWENAYRKSHRKDLRDTFRRSIDGSIAPKWFQKFLATQTRICNLLADRNRTLCRGKFTRSPEQEYFTSCKLETRVGDRILRIWGLPQLIVVRRRPEFSRSVEIIGPMVMARGHNWHSKDQKDADCVELDNCFVDYQIH